MKIVKTIKQYATTYSIAQQGNCSFRVSYTHPDSARAKHIEKIFNSVDDAEKFIAACKVMDMAISMNFR